MNKSAMRSLWNVLIVAIVSCIGSVQAADVASDSGFLVIRNGSDFAVLSVAVYRLEGGRESAVKRGTVAPVTTQIYTLPAGDYLATFDALNGTAAATEGRFSLVAGEDYTINFHAKGNP